MDIYTHYYYFIAVHDHLYEDYRLLCPFCNSVYFVFIDTDNDKGLIMKILSSNVSGI